jgi:cellulose biosynthesis protein BcsQ
MNGILALDAISKIDDFLSECQSNGTILNYKIVLQLSMRIEIDILIPNKKGRSWYFDQSAFIGLERAIGINEIEFENDESLQKQYQMIFSKKIDLGLRRRLSNFINANERSINRPCPIMTFYSYKGGTGRTTSLAFFASWLATHHNKKVVIIDCDFEAPGLTNYFDISEERKGITEYLLDSEFAKLTGQELDIKKDYSHQVRYEYVGKGDIYIIPAGNLDNTQFHYNSVRTNRTDYLEALSRIDIASKTHILDQFENFFLDLKKQLDLDFENSLILIDSRTGFNDTFAVLSTLSDIIVGFFGINKQSLVGLTQFLDTYGTVENSQNKQIALVNSISENLNYFQVFKDFVHDHISLNESKFTDNEFGLQNFANTMFRIPRTEFLGRIGTSLEMADKGSLTLTTSSSSIKDFVNLQLHTKIIRPDSEFEDFFNDLNKKIDFVIENNSEVEEIIEEDKNEPILENTAHPIDYVFFEQIKDKVYKLGEREKILKNIINEDHFPKPYADTGEVKPQKVDFFFRDCMKDIFNRDKYIIIGYKGTGKTHIYRAFENNEITEILCKREGQKPENFVFVNVIPIEKYMHYFSTDDGFMEAEKRELGIDYFFKSFWIIYSWSSLFKNHNILKLGISPSFDVFDINESNITLILEVISNRGKITAINKDLESLNNVLVKNNKTVILSYDQIDFVVKPNNWNEGVAPLINFWRSNPYSRIFPKVFVRADIFVDRLTNITNFNELQQEKSISLQWSKQELFAYFFKYLFSVSKQDFFALSYAYNGYSDQSKLMLLQIENELDSEGQISVSKETYLKFLVENFFGKYADRYHKQRIGYGENYDWFYNNLTDAKNAISIRPFLDLLNKAILIALEKRNLRSEQKFPNKFKRVLSAFYFTSNEAKAYAADRYYNDLAKDKGNEPLRLFYQYIKNDGLERFRVYEFTREQLDDLLKRIIEFTNYKNEESLKGKSIDDFKNLLINNGILSVTHITNRQLTRYVIPFLYRSYFAVGKPNKLTLK